MNMHINISAGEVNNNNNSHYDDDDDDYYYTGESARCYAQNVILLTQNCFYFCSKDLSEIYLA